MFQRNSTYLCLPPRIFGFFAIFIILSGWLGTSVVHAQEMTAKAQNLPRSYELSLVFRSSSKTLEVDKKASAPYRISFAEYRSQTTPAAGDFLGIILGAKERELAKFGILAPTGPSQERMTFTVFAPYFPNAERIDFYKGSTLLFSLDVRASAVCIENELCELSLGETAEYCPADCKDVDRFSGAIPPPPEESDEVLPKSDSIAPDAPFGDSLEDTQAKPFRIFGMNGQILFSIVLFLCSLLSFLTWFRLRAKAKSENS